MRRNIFGAFAIAGGLSLWAALGASANATPTSTSSFDPSACTGWGSGITLVTSISGVSQSNAAEANADLAELNAETTLAQAEIVAEANAAIAELNAASSDEAFDEDGPTTAAELSAITSEACQALVNLKAEYTAAVAELTAEFAQPQQPEQPEATAPDRHDTERDAPETEQRDSEQHTYSGGGDD